MKKILILLLIICSLFVAETTFAKEQATESTKVDYNLPYHGMLPDSPLYFIKTFRDRVMATLISDSLKKAEFDLLQADKRLSASVALFERGKKDLAESTISKGLNYYEDGVKSLEMARKQGKEIGGLLTNYDLSIKKHVEVLGELKGQTTGEVQKKFSALERRGLGYEKKVAEFKAQVGQ
jgi:hypothetical protein